MTIDFVLIALAVICFGAKVVLTLVGSDTGRLDLIALGLTLWALTGVVG